MAAHDEHNAPRAQDPPPTGWMTGPGLPPPAGPPPASAWRVVPAPVAGASEAADTLPSDVLDAVHEIDEEEAGARLARRIFVAGLAIAAIAALCWVVLPMFGMVLPPMVPLLLFGVIAFAAITASPEAKPRRGARATGDCCSPDDEGRPICCSGPRPPRLFK